jgi:AraC-like DNA-binding protein
VRAWVHFDWVYAPPIRRTPILTYAPAEPEWDLVRRAPAFVPPEIRTGSLPRPDAFFDSHRRLEELYNHGTLRERTACRGLFAEMLLSLVAPEGDPVDTDRSRRTASNIRQALDNLAGRPFAAAPSVRTFLASLGRSYDHQARLFKAAYGATPLQYVNTRRMERAKSLLRETRLPVARIAEGLGFGDVVYFNRLFRKHTGTTPGGYRSRQLPRSPG